ncbi:ABC transporter ATP-binding protein [Nonomuraea jiangxiensis]|uniref:ATP-binding cassette, subfamily B n=1 Tax=Nonomuraea jiangxiensis TaxID=633440 RepID=A0A1G8JA44_9ACTN|nr:ABC transporter ATP-binding protein [Nonomuraea jiangxiensis]SDI27943.1 ATP-binding cassette, subfamily B [Nonomuraea jiangxiensis]
MTGELLRRAAAAWELVWRAGAPATLTSFALAVTAGIWPVTTAWLTKFLLDELARGTLDTGKVIGLAVGLGLTGLLVGTLPQVSQYVDAQLGRAVNVRARDRLFTAVNRFTGLAPFESPHFHDRLQLAQQASQSASSQIVIPMLRCVQGTVTAAGFVATLIVLSPVVTALVLVAVVPLVVAQFSLSRRHAQLVWTINPNIRRQLFYAGLLTDVSTAKEVRLFGLGSFLRQRLLTELRSTNDAERALDRRTLAVQGLLSLLGAMVTAFGLIWAVTGAVSGHLSVGDVAVSIAAVAGLQAAFGALVGHVAGIFQALLLFGHYLAVVRAQPDLPVPPDPEPVPDLGRCIEFDDVWFRYDESHPWVLRGVNLKIPAGRSVALVGLNGAGKSTLVKLLCRFYDPQRGAIRWDGVDLRDFDPADLRRRISAVFQDYVAYELTAGENIAVGDLRALTDQERIRRAASHAGVDEVVSRLPQGYDTMLSRIFVDHAHDDPATGVLLSGGQWQRIALARAYLRDRRDLLILDEPSSGLDAEAEHALHEALRRHRTGRTSLLISHRLSAVLDADQIVVLNEGRIIQQGTHAQLMDVGGEYARLFTLQAAAYRRDRAGEPDASLSRP